MGPIEAFQFVATVLEPYFFRGGENDTGLQRF